MKTFIFFLLLSFRNCIDRCGANAPATTGILEGKVGGKKTVVLLDSLSTKISHSYFFDVLTKRGHQISFFLAESVDSELVKFGEILYHNLIVFSPRSKLDSDFMNLSAILDFVDFGGNVLIAGQSNMSKSFKNLCANVGVDFDPIGSEVLDHFNHESFSSEPKHDIIRTNRFLENKYILGDLTKNASVLFRGIGHTNYEENILVSSVLKPSDKAYSTLTKKGASTITKVGSDIVLVSAIQSRNNARIIVSGSLDMFSNKFFQAKGFRNKDFCSEISKWVFAERGVLRASNVNHTKGDGTLAELLLKQKTRLDLPQSLFPEPEIAKNSQVYRIGETIDYSLKVEEYDADKGGWVPFAASDLQVEFVMLDPFERITLSNDPQSGIFSTTFTAPDKYGIFKFRIMYRRVGLTVLLINTQVSLRPYKHNEHERFIPSAYPYYFSVFSIMIGFFVFIYSFINAACDPPSKTKKID